MRGQLICFTGIDGSGKTTQSKRLFETLRKFEVNCEYSWSRWEPFLLKPFISLFRTKAKRVKNNGGHTPETEYSVLKKIKKRIFKYKFVLAFYQYTALLDYYLQIKKKISRPLEEGKVVICDRYVYDLCVDFAVNFGYSEAGFARLLKWRPMAYFPRPDFIFLIDVPPEVGASRKADGTPIGYIEDGRKFYQTLSKYIEVKALDGMDEANSLAKVVFAEVQKGLGAKGKL